MLAFLKAGFKVFRYSFGRPHQCFSITLKVSELANVFEKNEKKNKTYLCTSYINFFH